MDILTDSREDPASQPVGRPARRLRHRSAAIAVSSVVAGLALGATGVAMAQNGGTSQAPAAASSAALRPATAAPSPSPNDDRRGHMGGMRGMGPGMGALGVAGAPVHGEFVVPKTGGGYQTIVVQRGTVTAVSATSITLKSADGFSQTYAVTADTLVNAARDGISTIKKDATATVQATRSGSSLTAVHVADKSLFDTMRKRFGGRDGGPHGPDGDAVTPSPSATGSST